MKLALSETPKTGFLTTRPIELVLIQIISEYKKEIQKTLC